jgi:hypothetical protein
MALDARTTKALRASLRVLEVIKNQSDLPDEVRGHVLMAMHHASKVKEHFDPPPNEECVILQFPSKEKTNENV